MKIAMIGPRGIPNAYGGIERHVEAISPRLVELGHEVTVYGRSHCCEEGTYRGVDVRTVPTIRTKHGETALYALLASLDAFRRDYDLIHYHGIGPSLFAWLPKLGQRTVVATVHGPEWQRPKWGALARRILRLGETSAYRFPDATVVVSRNLGAYYRDAYQARTEWIPNGVDPVAFDATDEVDLPFGLAPKSYLLFAGRLVEEKGLQYLIPAFLNLDTSLDLVIAGEEAGNPEYVEEIRRSAAGDPRIRFVGFVEGPDMHRLYAGAYAFVLPSDLEGLSVALLEAMSHGLPVVVSELPENLEVIDDPDRGRAGVSFTKSDPQALAACLRELLKDPQGARALGDRARRVVDAHYTWDSVVDRLEQVYGRVVSPPVG